MLGGQTIQKPPWLADFPRRALPVVATGVLGGNQQLTIRRLGRSAIGVRCDEAALECRSTPFVCSGVRGVATSCYLGKCFFHAPPTFQYSLARCIGPSLRLSRHYAFRPRHLIASAFFVFATCGLLSPVRYWLHARRLSVLSAFAMFCIAVDPVTPRWPWLRFLRLFIFGEQAFVAAPTAGRDRYSASSHSCCSTLRSWGEAPPVPVTV